MNMTEERKYGIHLDQGTGYLGWALEVKEGDCKTWWRQEVWS
jgi:hypothetical protein